MFITRTPLSNADENIFSIQKSNLSSNGPGPLPSSYSDKKIQYPITIASKSKVERILEENYTIKFVLTEDHSIFKINGENIHYYGYFCTLKFK